MKEACLRFIALPPRRLVSVSNPDEESLITLIIVKNTNVTEGLFVGGDASALRSISS